MVRRILSSIVCVCFMVSSVLGATPVRAAELMLPVPGTMLSVTPSFMPPMMRGLKIHPDNPLLFDFIVDTGSSQMMVDSEAFKAESEKLIKYFLASMTIKEEDLWVNLSPYEKDRITSDALGATELGRDMLAQDYILKQLTASLIYPENELGKAFWDKVYAQAREKFGTTELPVDTFNKVWITADTAKVLERDDAGYVIASHLKVMLESDFLAMQKSTVNGQRLTGDLSQADAPSSSQAIAQQILRDVVIPSIEKEVNEGTHFANLRQIFNAMILASWYKLALKEALLSQVYADKGKVDGVKNDDPAVSEKIYAQYLAAYKTGVFNYIKEEPDQATGEMMPKRYFSGGVVPGEASAPLRARTLLAGESLPGFGDMAMISTQMDQARMIKTASMSLKGIVSFGSQPVRASVLKDVLQVALNDMRTGRLKNDKFLANGFQITYRGLHALRNNLRKSDIVLIVEKYLPFWLLQIDKRILDPAYDKGVLTWRVRSGVVDYTPQESLQLLTAAVEAEIAVAASVERRHADDLQRIRSEKQKRLQEFARRKSLGISVYGSGTDRAQSVAAKMKDLGDGWKTGVREMIRNNVAQRQSLAAVDQRVIDEETLLLGWMLATDDPTAAWPKLSAISSEGPKRRTSLKGALSDWNLEIRIDKKQNRTALVVRTSRGQGGAMSAVVEVPALLAEDLWERVADLWNQGLPFKASPSHEKDWEGVLENATIYAARVMARAVCQTVIAGDRAMAADMSRRSFLKTLPGVLVAPGMLKGEAAVAPSESPVLAGISVNLYQKAVPYIRPFLKSALTTGTTDFPNVAGLTLSHRGAIAPGHVATDTEKYAASSYDMTGWARLRFLNNGDTTVLDTLVTNWEQRNDKIYNYGSGYVNASGTPLRNIPYNVIRILGRDISSWWSTWDWNVEQGGAAEMITLGLDAYAKTGNVRYLNFAKGLADALLPLQDIDGGFRFGPIGIYHPSGNNFFWNLKSTEKNLRIYWALQNLVTRTGLTKYSQPQANLKTWLKSMYNTTEHLFHTSAQWNGSQWVKSALGVANEYFATDVTAMAPDFIFTDTYFGATQTARDAEVRAMFDATERRTAVLNAAGMPMAYKFSGAQTGDYISVEFTCQMALSYLRAAWVYKKRGDVERFRFYYDRYRTLVFSMKGFFRPSSEDPTSLVAPYASNLDGTVAAGVPTGTGYHTPSSEASLVSSVWFALAQGGFDSQLLSGGDGIPEWEPMISGIRVLSNGYREISISDPVNALSYSVLWASNLNGPWTTVATNVTASQTGTTVWVDTVARGAKGFYKVQAQLDAAMLAEDGPMGAAVKRLVVKYGRSLLLRSIAFLESEIDKTAQNHWELRLHSHYVLLSEAHREDELALPARDMAIELGGILGFVTEKRLNEKAYRSSYMLSFGLRGPWGWAFLAQAKRAAARAAGQQKLKTALQKIRDIVESLGAEAERPRVKTSDLSVDLDEAQAVVPRYLLEEFAFFGDPIKKSLKALSPDDRVTAVGPRGVSPEQIYYTRVRWFATTLHENDSRVQIRMADVRSQITAAFDELAVLHQSGSLSVKTFVRVTSEYFKDIVDQLAQFEQAPQEEGVVAQKKADVERILLAGLEGVPSQDVKETIALTVLRHPEQFGSSVVMQAKDLIRNLMAGNEIPQQYRPYQPADFVLSHPQEFPDLQEAAVQALYPEGYYFHSVPLQVAILNHRNHPRLRNAAKAVIQGMMEYHHQQISDVASLSRLCLFLNERPQSPREKFLKSEGLRGTRAAVSRWLYWPKTASLGVSLDMTDVIVAHWQDLGHHEITSRDWVRSLFRAGLRADRLELQPKKIALLKAKTAALVYDYPQFFPEITGSSTDGAQVTPGGIELNAKKMGLDIDKQGAGVEVNFDAAQIEQFRSGDFTGIVPIILKITPIQSPATVLGFVDNASSLYSAVGNPVLDGREPEAVKI